MISAVHNAVAFLLHQHTKNSDPSVAQLASRHSQAVRTEQTEIESYGKSLEAPTPEPEADTDEKEPEQTA